MTPGNDHTSRGRANPCQERRAMHRACQRGSAVQHHRCCLVADPDLGGHAAGLGAIRVHTHAAGHEHLAAGPQALHCARAKGSHDRLLADHAVASPAHAAGRARVLLPQSGRARRVSPREQRPLHGQQPARGRAHHAAQQTPEHGCASPHRMHCLQGMGPVCRGSAQSAEGIAAAGFEVVSGDLMAGSDVQWKDKSVKQQLPGPHQQKGHTNHGRAVGCHHGQER